MMCPSEERSPVHAGELRALVEQIIVQLAIAVNLAALLPRLKQEIGLSFVFAGPFAPRVLQPGVEAARVYTEKP